MKHTRDAGAVPALTSALSSGPLDLTMSQVRSWVEMLENGDSGRVAQKECIKKDISRSLKRQIQKEFGQPSHHQNGLHKYPYKVRHGCHDFNPNTWGAEAGLWKVQGHVRLQKDTNARAYVYTHMYVKPQG